MVYFEFENELKFYNLEARQVLCNEVNMCASYSCILPDSNQIHTENTA